MKDSIKNYIEYLRRTHDFKISLHGDGVLPHLDFLAPYHTHECTYCMYVKGSKDAFKRCIEGQIKAQKKLAESGAYFGSCYAGVGEFVFPIVAFDSIVGMISVGGYLGSVEKRRAFALKYGFYEGQLRSLEGESLNADIPDLAFVKTLIDPLSAMLSLFIEKNNLKSLDSENLYGGILSILHVEYARKITISDIASKCHYSVSFVSRHFKEKSGKTINEYLNDIRMEKAKRLLCESDMRIEDIGAFVGFSDTNYFISRFSKYYKISPKKYRSTNKS